MITQFLNCIEREPLYGFEKLGKLSNNLCHECLGKEIASWLAIYPKGVEKIMNQIEKYAQEMDFECSGNKKCALCKSKKAALCASCFAHEIFNILKRAKLDKMILMDYLCAFNFDKEHERQLKLYKPLK